VKKQIIITALVTTSILVFTCTTPRNAVKDNTPADQETASQPAFNPTPSGVYLTPAESMKTMHLAKGYHLELVASEPMIKEPVAIAWDGNARMYVAEMLTYMQDADATGEQQPKSRISLLEDTDNDGKMDKSTVFVDSLLLPRMIQCVNHELLVNETNTVTINSYTDTNGDGKADVKKVVYQNPNYKASDANMEHQRSGLDWNLDNWMYMTYEPVRFRYTTGTMQVDTIPSGAGGGQWGLTHDNYGRLYYSSAGGETPALSFQINPRYGKLDYPDQFTPEFQEVWPIIATPDVQGGEMRLRPNNTLNHFTACCGQSIYRGDRLPQDLVGDYILCEPVARIIRRAKVIDLKGKIVMQNNYYRSEFISSSDMNFRPVNTATGPDGNLYIVDMHRGIIQQGNWTRPASFLRNKIDSLGLARNVGHGRIYRVVNDEFKRGPKPNMLNEPTAKLVTYLGHSNGWWRDNAQKIIIVRGDKSVIPALKAMAMAQPATMGDDSGHLARIHALWTLEGMNAIDKEVLSHALTDANPQVRKTAVWISESYIKNDDAQIIDKLASLKTDPSYDVKVQLLLSLNTGKSDKAKAIYADILNQQPANEVIAATKQAIDKNEDVRTFGSRLGVMAAADRTLILNGAAIFKSLCASCHGSDGKGLAIGGAGLAAPPLAGSKVLNQQEKNTPIRILLHGLTGPVEGKTYPSVMPAMGANSDEWIASVVSYIRYELGTGSRNRQLSPVVKPEEVKKIRDENSGRTKAWTAAELEDKSKTENPQPAVTTGTK
jgi:mono/diheme cytochrome c family protein/glucose/arabinose dehydrogenase